MLASYIRFMLFFRLKHHDSYWRFIPMIGQTKLSNRYLESLRDTPAPVLASELPNISFDINEIIAYAQKRNVAVCELSEEELAPFIHGAGDWRSFRRKYYTMYGKEGI